MGNFDMQDVPASATHVINGITLRTWQSEATRYAALSTEKSFMLEVCPAAGKTLCSAAIAYDIKMVSPWKPFFIYVAPNTAIKGNCEGGVQGDYLALGLEMRTVNSSWEDTPPAAYDGIVITYQQLLTTTDVFRAWKANGYHLVFIFDEVHHLSEQNRWGRASAVVFEIADKIISMTGTPFRSDGRQIPFLPYEENIQGATVVNSDYKYVYRNAIADNVCRPVAFHLQSGVATYSVNGRPQPQIEIANATTDEELRGAKRAILNPRSPWMREVVIAARDRLERERLTDPAAAGLIVCPPGSDENDERYLQQMAEVVREVTGHDPVVVSCSDDEADRKIAHFRIDHAQKWIIAIRKISEGVDIKRLRVLVVATHITTRLLFVQLVGRVQRVVKGEQPGTMSYVFMPELGEMPEWAREIENDVVIGLRQLKELGPRGPAGPGPQVQNAIAVHDVQHEHGDVIMHDGTRFTVAERDIIEAMILRSPPMRAYSGLHWRTLFDSGCFVPPADLFASQVVELPQKARRSLERIKEEKSARINGDVRSFAGLLCKVERARDYGKTMQEIYARINNKFKIKGIDDAKSNHGVDMLDAIIDFVAWLRKTYEDKQHAAA